MIKLPPKIAPVTIQHFFNYLAHTTDAKEVTTWLAEGSPAFIPVAQHLSGHMNNASDALSMGFLIGLLYAKDINMKSSLFEQYLDTVFGEETVQ